MRPLSARTEAVGGGAVVEVAALHQQTYSLLLLGYPFICLFYELDAIQRSSVSVSAGRVRGVYASKKVGETSPPLQQRHYFSRGMTHF